MALRGGGKTMEPCPETVAVVDRDTHTATDKLTNFIVGKILPAYDFRSVEVDSENLS